MVSFGSLLRWRRKEVVGLAHAVGRDELDRPIRDERLAREFSRAEKKLKRMPRGAKVGVEMTPKELEGIRGKLAEPHDYGTNDVLDSVTRRALELGLVVVPLDSESGLRRHLEKRHKLRLTSTRLREMGRLGMEQSPEDKSKREQRFLDLMASSYLRSIGMGKKLQEEGLRLSFTGDVHAHDLKPVLERTHKFSLSPEPMAKFVAKEFQRRLVASEGLRTLREKLEAHARKRLATRKGRKKRHAK